MITFMGQEYKIKTWSGEHLGKYVAVDTETEVVPFHMTPRIVTLQAFGGGDTVYYVPLEKIRLFLNRHYDSFYILHNASFDMDVIAKHLEDDKIIYDLYDRNRVRDTSVLYRLLHLASSGFVPFKYSLALLTEKYCGTTLEKDERRENFAQFLGKGISDIPQEYLEYGALDVIATFFVYNTLMGLIKVHDKYNTLLSHDIQVKGELALTHIRKNGIGFDLLKRDEWLAEMDLKMEQEADILATWGFVRGAKGIKDRYERIMTLLNIAPLLPRTEDGQLSSKRDDLEPHRGNPFVDAYLNYMELEKATSFVRDIESARIHPRYNGILNTGRTSCSKPNFQQLPRVGGVREMFKAQDGYTFIITDYSTLELCTLAQVCKDTYGESVMGDLINEGRDLHRYYASVMRGVEEKDVTKQWRQEAKAANFGFPGGLGNATFMQFAAGYGLELSEAEADAMKRAWKQAFPEMDQYLSGEQGFVYTLTGRKRGNTTFCAEKNTPFQGLAADGLKIALYNLDKAGFKIVGEVHDEIICEVPKEKAEELLPIQEKIMIESMETVVPDIKISVESQISNHYTK